ncbi:MAG: FHA domain-containing protein [Deltaproteobacteria bacterium]|nr:FHA domain-containing protein [Deltaproteobacteria bacterium]
MSGYFLWTDDQGRLDRSEIGEQPLTIGSRSPCGVVVDNDAVGPIHAAIEREQNGCRLRRLSRVRTLSVNGRPAEEQRLSHGDKIALGTYEGRFVSAVSVASRMLRLVLTREEGEIRVDLPVAGSITVIGRLEGDVLVDDSGVSSRHLEIENFGPGLRYVRDLGSTNGTELNGKPLGSNRHPLEDGDVLAIGRVRIAVKDGGKTPDSVSGVVQRTVIFVPDTARA